MTQFVSHLRLECMLYCFKGIHENVPETAIKFNDTVDLFKRETVHIVVTVRLTKIVKITRERIVVTPRQDGFRMLVIGDDQSS